MHFGLSLIFAWNLHQKFSVAAKYSKFAGGSLNKVWSPFSLSKKQFIFWLKFRKIVDYFHILQPNHQVKQSCPTPFQENWIGGWFRFPPWLQPRARILRTLRSVQRKIRHSHCREIPRILLQISTKLDENINVVEKKISVDASSK